MGPEKIKITIEELLKRFRSCKANPYDKRIIHTETGLEFYTQSKESYGDWFTLASEKDFHLKWSGHYDDLQKYFHFEKENSST